MKRILNLIIAFFICINSNGQFTAFHYGFLGGLSSTWLLNSNIPKMGEDVKYKSTISGSLGVFALWNFNKTNGVSFDLIFSEHNQSYTGSGLIAINTYQLPFYAKMKIYYLDFPILYHFGKSNGFYLELGPQFSYLLDAKEDYKNITPIVGGGNVEFNVDYKNDLNRFNISGVMGFGYNVNFGHFISVDFGPRFGYGFIDITKPIRPKYWEGHSQTTTLYANINNLGFYPRYPSYTKTNRVFGIFFIKIIM